jgi:hypothetical protein
MLQEILQKYVVPALLSVIAALLAAIVVQLKAMMRALARGFLAWAANFEREASKTAGRADDVAAVVILTIARAFADATESTLGTRQEDHPAEPRPAIGGTVFVDGKQIPDRRAPRPSETTAAELLARRENDPNRRGPNQ